MSVENCNVRFAAGARGAFPSPIPWSRAPCGPSVRATIAATLLAVSLPALPTTNEHLEAALTLIQPPTISELERIVDLKCGNRSVDTAAAERLSDVYRSGDLRKQIAEIYTRYLTLQDLKHLQKAFESQPFRKYKSVAPLIFAEVLDLEEKTLRQHGIGTTHCASN